MAATTLATQERDELADLHGHLTSPPEHLIDTMCNQATPHGVGSGFGGRIALVERMINRKDIRRPR